jgi:hypothetical protein
MARKKHTSFVFTLVGAKAKSIAPWKLCMEKE